MVAAIIALVVSASSAFADPPGRVARISFIAGSCPFVRDRSMNGARQTSTIR